MEYEEFTAIVMAGEGDNYRLVYLMILATSEKDAEIFLEQFLLDDDNFIAGTINL